MIAPLVWRNQGSGKTAVGLHRAAYLLYLYRERLRRGGVLIVGPNQAFLGYIAAVLPALGELEVQQSTIENLIARVPVRATDPVGAELVKHDPRMAEVLRRALWSRLGRPEQPLQVSDGAYRWRVSVEALRRVIDDVRREDPPYGLGRERAWARIVSLLQRQAEAKSGESPPESWTRRMGRSRAVVEVLDASWPAVTPEGLVFDLLCDPEELARAADGTLTAEEQAAIVWAKPPRTARATKWSSADLVLIDEAAGLLERQGSVGHIVLDEAHDLSAAVVAEVKTAMTYLGSIGVIAADHHIDLVRTALDSAGMQPAALDSPAAGQVTVVPASLAKGLEYDHVIVIEPAAIVAAEPRGLNRLYVVLTRAVSRLSVLHREPLPAALTD